MAGKCPEGLEEQFIEDCPRLSVIELSEKYDRAPSTIREWRTGLYREGKLLWWPGIQVHDCRVYDDYIRVDGDAIVVSDLEIPYHDAELLGYAVSVGKLFKIKTLIIAGDLLANDAIGFFASRSEDTDESTRFTVNDSLMAGRDVLKAFFKWFEHIIVIKGNHDQRNDQVRELGWFQMMKDNWGDLGNLEISFYKWCELDGQRIEHFGNYSGVPGSVARDRAAIEDCTVIGGHTHHFSWSWAKNGKHMAIDLGHCTRPETRYYKTVNGVTRHPKWVAGFWAYKDGYWFPFPKEATNWEFWLQNISIKKERKKKDDSGDIQ